MQESRPARDAGATDASIETDVGICYLFIDAVLQHGGIAMADRFLAVDFVQHTADGDQDRRQFIAHMTARQAALPDATWTIESLAGVGGLVVCHLTVTAPTLAAQAWETVVMRFVNQRIAESWSICDDRLRAG